MQDKFLTKIDSGTKEYANIFLLFWCIFIIYLWCAPRTVVLEDDGLFILAGFFNGIAHPPGYPLFTLLSHFATWLPIGSIAYRVHILSAFFGALSCVCLWWLMRLLFKEREYAYLGVFCYGFSCTFWSQAIIADVYTLNVLLVILLAFLSLYWSRIPATENPIYFLGLMAFIYGIGLSNHWPLLILSTPMFLCFIWNKWKVLICNIPKVLPFMILGLLPYLWMVLRSQMDPVISFYGPIETWADFIFYISRQGYVEVETSLTAGWLDKFQFLEFILHESLQQFGVAFFVFILIGFFRQWRVWPGTVCLGLVLGYLGSTLFLVLLLGFDFDLLHRNIFRVYPLIPYAVLSIWLVLGVHTVLNFLFQKYKKILQIKHIEAGVIVVIITVVFVQNFKTNFRANDSWAEKYAMVILGTLKPNSILFTSGDMDQNSVGYLNLIMKYRQDVTLYHEKGLLFPNRLFYPGKHTNTQRRKLIDKFILNETRPIYYTYGLPQKYDVVDFGLYRQIIPNQTENIDKAVALSDITQYFQEILVAGEPNDPWEAMHYRVLVTEYCQLSLKILEFANQNASEKQKVNNWVKTICNSYHGKLEQIEVLLKHHQPDWLLVNRLLNEAEALKEQSIFKADLAKIEYLRGETLQRTGNQDLAMESYQRSLEIWPHPRNPANMRLKEITGSK